MAGLLHFNYNAYLTLKRIKEGKREEEMEERNVTHCCPILLISGSTEEVPLRGAKIPTNKHGKRTAQALRALNQRDLCSPGATQLVASAMGRGGLERTKKDQM